jgi:hypothetical protein
MAIEEEAISWNATAESKRKWGKLDNYQINSNEYSSPFTLF